MLMHSAGCSSNGNKYVSFGTVMMPNACDRYRMHAASLAYIMQPLCASTTASHLSTLSQSVHGTRIQP